MAQNDINTKIEQQGKQSTEGNFPNIINGSGKTEETLINNEGADDDYILSNSQNIKLNENKVKEMVNEPLEENDGITPEADPEQINDINIEDNNINQEQKEKNNSNISQNRKKIIKNNYNVNKRITFEEKNETNKNDENIDELFKKAIENSVEKYPPIEHDNNISGKVTEVLYDKYVGKNIKKSKHLDIYSKFRDESIRQEREFNRTKEDAKKINNMIERQEKYEEIKHDKKLGRQKEIKKKLKKECAFIPNGKKNTPDNIRNPSDFYSDQKKFVEKKAEQINKLTQSKIDDLEKIQKTTKVSKKSEKIANQKNPGENLEQFCKRLAEEKLKNPKETLNNNKKDEDKKMTKKEMQDLTEKLHKEGETFKNNREKKEKEQIDKIRNRDKKNFVLEKSKKVILDKFVSDYDKVVKSLFDNKSTKDNSEKNQNYEITFDEYKTLLNNLGFLKNINPDDENNKYLINGSFENYLNPIEQKIDTNKFLTFCLAALGIYKGKDEKIQEHSSKITVKTKPEERDKENDNNKTINKNKKQMKTSTEFIKSVLPNLDLDKYGYTEKECNNIKSQFFTLFLGISESWAKDLNKKKQERLDKIEETNKKNNADLLKKLENKQKREEEIIDNYRKKIFNDELISQNEKDNNNNAINTKKTLTKSFKVEDMYEILQKKKQKELDALKAKKEEDFNKECTFQPNSKTRPVNKKEVAKNIEKLYIEGKNSYMKKLNSDNNMVLNEEEKNCTFKPAIKDYKGDYFENNPLKEDTFNNSEIKKREKLREEQGYVNKEIKRQMAFGIEPKSNKDNINKRVAANRGEKIVNSVENEFKDYGSFDDKGNKILIKLEVNLENNKNELLVIQPEEDYVKVVDNFCFKHKLDDNKKLRLIRVIRDKIRENENEI